MSLARQPRRAACRSIQCARHREVVAAHRGADGDHRAERCEQAAAESAAARADIVRALPQAAAIHRSWSYGVSLVPWPDPRRCRTAGHHQILGSQTCRRRCTSCASHRACARRAPTTMRAPCQLDSAVQLVASWRPFARLMASSSRASQLSAFDVLIRNARVMDGTGNPWLRADVGIRGDRITAVGQLGAATAARTIDAARSHGRARVHRRALACRRRAPQRGAPPGAAAASRRASRRSSANPDGGGPVDLAAQRAALEAARPGPNVALLIGHGSVRRAVMGSARPRADGRRAAEDEGPRAARHGRRARSGCRADCSTCPAASRRPRK